MIPPTFLKSAPEQVQVLAIRQLDVRGCASLSLHKQQEDGGLRVCIQRSSISILTCSLVVRPRATSTMWKPVSPMTGIKKRPAMHITTRLDAKGQGLTTKRSDHGSL